jgi:hypothetical protein
MRLMSVSRVCWFAFVVGACSGAEPVADGAPAAQGSQGSQGQSGTTTAAAAGGTSAPSTAQAGTRASAAVAGQGGALAPAQTSGGAGSPAASSGNAGAAANGGAGAAAGSGNAGSAAGASAPKTSCGNITTREQPFGCKFAWGTNDPGGSLAAFAGLSFMSKWVGYELDMSGSLPRCDGCSWLREQVASTALVPVYYAYFIGYFGKANGLPDGNENPNGPNLTTDAAKLIRTQRAKLVGLYREYAKQTAQAWPDKPLVWLLEGDFIQYTAETQKEALSLTELAELAQEISCAIKSEMPNAVVAINHSTWNGDEVTNNLWNALSSVSYDLVWTTGVANNNGYFEMGANDSIYNAMTAKYAYVHQLTGRDIFVDTSFGLSEMADSWSSADATTLNARIDEGVIAANVTKPPASYVQTATSLAAQLKEVCQ